jgi:hypothetical protein
MGNVYATDSSLSEMIRYKEMLPHLKRSLNILSLWMVTIDTDASNQSNSLSFEQKNSLLKTSIWLERQMVLAAMHRNQLNVTKGHWHRCFVNSRRLGVDGEEKPTSIFGALHVYVNLRQRQGDFSSAVLFAEEGYNLVVDAYDPVHPQVQEAASELIVCLIKKSNLYNAERFAEQIYVNLRDVKNEIDQEGVIVARGAYNLADVIYQQENGDLIKTEGLAREAIRIRLQLHGSHDSRISANCLLLARILRKQGNFGDETKELFVR